MKLSSIDSKQQRELFQLKEEIKHHNLLYYQENKPEITDAEYDKLKRKALELGVKILNEEELYKSGDE